MCTNMEFNELKQAVNDVLLKAPGERERKTKQPAGVLEIGDLFRGLFAEVDHRMEGRP